MPTLDENFLEFVRVGDVPGTVHCIELGADVNYGGGEPLNIAAFYGHLNILKILITAGADIGASNPSCLVWARLSKYPESWNYLQKICYVRNSRMGRWV